MGLGRWDGVAAETSWNGVMSVAFACPRRPTFSGARLFRPHGRLRVVGGIIPASRRLDVRFGRRLDRLHPGAGLFSSLSTMCGPDFSTRGATVVLYDLRGAV